MHSTTSEPITAEQLDACSRIIDETTNEVFYRVQSASSPEEYTVRFVPDDEGGGRLSCTCKAGQNSIACWHIRAAKAHHALQQGNEPVNMTPDERTRALLKYRARDHLIKIKSKDGSLREYLPAAYRFYELSLRYDDANFSTELLSFDIERNFCIVKCRLYLGADYEFSTKKVEACKSGLLTNLDRVETAAQARCCRLFGIGTEYALESDSSPVEEEETAEEETPVITLSVLKHAVLSAGLAHNREQWIAWKQKNLAEDVPDDALTKEQIAHLYQSVVTHVKPLKSVS